MTGSNHVIKTIKAQHEKLAFILQLNCYFVNVGVTLTFKGIHHFYCLDYSEWCSWTRALFSSLLYELCMFLKLLYYLPFFDYYHLSIKFVQIKPLVGPTKDIMRDLIRTFQWHEFFPHGNMARNNYFFNHFFMVHALVRLLNWNMLMWENSPPQVMLRWIGLTVPDHALTWALCTKLPISLINNMGD